jgi:hypothetical protein
MDRVPQAMLQDLTTYFSSSKRVREAVRRAVGAGPSAPAGKESEWATHVADAVDVTQGTIASGEKLLRDGEKLAQLRATMHGKVEAGEMEAAGVVEACRGANLPWLVIRGISDFGDELKDDRFHGFAARAAAAVMVDFLGHGLSLPRVDHDRDEIEPLPFKTFTPKGLEATTGPNPFIFGRYIDRDEDFFGREEEKKWILDAIEKGQPVQLLGENLMGKTSLLKWVQRHVLLDRPAVWVDPTRGFTPATMVAAIAGALGRAEIAERLGRAEATKEEAAAAVDALVPFVLLMDDADALSSLGKGFDEGFFGVLRGHVQERRLTWVSASQGDLAAMFAEKGLHSRFLNDALKFWVGPLDAGAARRLAARGMAAERVVEMAGGLAFGVQWLGDWLHRRGGQVTPARDAYADQMEPVFTRWWRGLAVEERQLLKRCLAGVAFAEVEGEARTRRKLRRLADKGLVAVREDRFVVEGEAWREFVQYG